MEAPNSLTWYELNLTTPHSQHKRLWGAVISDTGSIPLVDWLAKFIRDNNIPQRNDLALIRAIYNYSLYNIKYFREIPERFVAPLRTIEWGIGDCDDKSRFIAACLRTFRIPVRLKFITFYFPKPKGTKRHVLPEAKYKNVWIPLETVTDKIPFGVDPEILANSKGIKTKSYFIGDK